MSLRLDYPLTFKSTLATREKIRVEEHFVLTPGLSHRLRYLCHSQQMVYLENEIGRDLYAQAQSVTNRWALQFSSAGAALSIDAYSSLAGSLTAIASELFTLTSVTVANIIPLTKKLDPPPAPTPLALPPADPMVSALEGLIGTTVYYEQIRTNFAIAVERFPELFEDPKFGDRIKNLWDREAARAVLKSKGEK